MSTIACCGFCSKVIDVKAAIEARKRGERAYCDDVCERADRSDIELTVGALMLRQS